MYFLYFLFVPFYSLLWIFLLSGDLSVREEKKLGVRWSVSSSMFVQIKMTFQQTSISLNRVEPRCRMLIFQFFDLSFPARFSNSPGVNHWFSNKMHFSAETECVESVCFPFLDGVVLQFVPLTFSQLVFVECRLQVTTGHRKLGLKDVWGRGLLSFLQGRGWEI